MKCFFITPTYNKAHLIGQVFDGIVNSVSGEMDYKIIFVVDGCTDNTEEVLKNKIEEHSLQDKVVLLTAPNIHEILSLNLALQYIKDNLNPAPEDLIFTVQDDVVIEESNVDLIFENLFNTYDDLGYVSFRLALSLMKTGDTIAEYNFAESEFGHWKQLGLNHFTEIKHYDFLVAEAVVRSPTCVQWKRYSEVGFYNEELAPCGFDCQDFSIRMNLHGYRNGVYALKYRSDVDWGSTREKPETEVNSKMGQIQERNKAYLAKTYQEYFEKK